MREDKVSGNEVCAGIEPRRQSRDPRQGPTGEGTRPDEDTGDDHQPTLGKGHLGAVIVLLGFIERACMEAAGGRGVVKRDPAYKNGFT